MSTVSNIHLLFLVLAAVPFSFSGVMVKRNSATPATPPTPAMESSSTSSFFARSMPATAAATSESLLDPLLQGASMVANPPLHPGINARSDSTVTTPVAASLISQTAAPSSRPSQTPSLNHEPDLGHLYGNVTVRNFCIETKYLWSVGAWFLHGPRDGTTGWGSPEDEMNHTITAGQNYTEPFRITCPPAPNGTMDYCWDHDKLRGQGVSIKISNNASNAQDILQLKYALLMNPLRNDTFYRLEYDVSLLDCADPNRQPGLFNMSSALARNITDGTATPADRNVKIEKCPGYQNGLHVWFTRDSRDGKICEPIECDGKTLCAQIYNFDRMRKGQPSKSCKDLYVGEMVLDLCSGNAGS